MSKGFSPKASTKPDEARDWFRSPRVLNTHTHTHTPGKTHLEMEEEDQPEFRTCSVGVLVLKK